MRLKFFAREDLLVFRPNISVSVGSPEQYVGRRFDPKLRGYPATKEGYECESETPGGQRLIELTRRDACLFPANDETAKACGMKAAPKVRWLSQGAYVLESSPIKDEPVEAPTEAPAANTTEPAPAKSAKG